MARGWESKAIEDQISEAEARNDARRRGKLSPEQSEYSRRKQALLLERTRIIKEMERAYMRRHLVVLERGLAHIDSELEKLETQSSSERADKGVS